MDETEESISRALSFFKMKRSLRMTSYTIFAFLDKHINIFRADIKKSRNLLPPDDINVMLMRKLLVLFILFRKRCAKFFRSYFTSVDILISLPISRRKRIPFPIDFSQLNELSAISTLISRPFVFGSLAARTPALMADLLSSVHINMESGTGKFLAEPQEIMDRVFLLRDKGISMSLSSFSFALRNGSFKDIQGFAMVLGNKLIEDYTITCNIEKLTVSVYRFVYPLAFTFIPSFFPSRPCCPKPGIKAKNIEIHKGLFKKAINILDCLTYELIPHDVINSLQICASMLVDGYMMTHNNGQGVEFGAQEFLPLLESAILGSNCPFLLGIFEWIDKYIQESEIESSSGYVVTSFLTVGQASLQYI